MNEDKRSEAEIKNEQTDNSVLTLLELIEAMGDQDFIIYIPYIGGDKEHAEN